MNRYLRSSMSERVGISVVNAFLNLKEIQSKCPTMVFLMSKEP